MKRLAIYTFWDKEGILRQYHMQYLLGLKEIAESVLLVANGELTQESCTKLDDAAINWLTRENKGLDFSAWKAGLDHFGQAFIQDFDELILCNCSCYGPIFPFSNAFDTMASSPCDFWGIYRQPKHPEGKYDSHIQSFFYVFRHTVLESDHFWNWWKNLTASSSYSEEVLTHEAIFTRYLEAYGFVSDTLMPNSKYERLFPDGGATFKHGDIMLMQDKSPLLKRRYMFRKDSDIESILSHIKQLSYFDVIDMCKDIKKNTNITASRIIRYYIKYIICSKQEKRKLEIILRNMKMIYKWKID